MSRPIFLASRLLSAVGIAASGPIGAQALPHLVALDTSGSDTAHFGLPEGPVQTPVTQVRLRFDTLLGAVLSDSFRLVEAGADRTLQTTLCGLLPDGDDIAIDLSAAWWNAVLREATLHFDAPRGLPRGHYRVLACDSLLGIGGLALDGDDDGLPGGIAQREFVVDETPMLENPTFDAGAFPWDILSAHESALLAFSADRDADDAPDSGSLGVFSGDGTFVLLGQSGCIAMPMVGSTDSSWRLRLRHRVAVGNVRIHAEFWHGFSGDMGEPDCRGPGIEQQAVFDAAPTVGFNTFDTGWRPFENPMPLGQLRLNISSRDGLPFQIHFDDIGLRFDTDVIFRDDFD